MSSSTAVVEPHWTVKRTSCVAAVALINTVPLEAAEVTLVAVLAKVKVVVVGTVVSTHVPLKVVSTPVIFTVSPTNKPCAADVVIVATFEVKALLLTVKAAENGLLSVAYSQTSSIVVVVVDAV